MSQDTKESLVMFGAFCAALVGLPLIIVTFALLVDAISGGC